MTSDDFLQLEISKAYKYASRKLEKKEWTLEQYLKAMRARTKKHNKELKEKNEMLQKVISECYQRAYSNVTKGHIPLTENTTEKEIYKEKETFNNEYNSIKSLDNFVLKELSNKYKISIADALSRKDDLENYCLSCGKKYHNYKAALSNFIKNALQEGKIKKVKNYKIQFPAELKEEDESIWEDDSGSIGGGTNSNIQSSQGQGVRR